MTSPTGSDLGSAVYVHDYRADVHRSQLNSFIRVAAAMDVELTRADFRQTADGYLTIDGMPAAQWLDAMTMD